MGTSYRQLSGGEEKKQDVSPPLPDSKKKKPEVSPQLKEVIACLSVDDAYSNIIESIKSITEASEEKDVEQLRKRLQEIFALQHELPSPALPLTRKIYEAAYHALIKLAEYWPLNNCDNGKPECIFTYGPMSPANRICTTSGHQFTKSNLLSWLTTPTSELPNGKKVFSNRNPSAGGDFLPTELNIIKTGQLYPNRNNEKRTRFNQQQYNNIVNRYSLVGGLAGLSIPAIVFGIVTAILSFTFPPVLLAVVGVLAVVCVPAGVQYGRVRARDKSTVEYFDSDYSGNDRDYYKKHPLLSHLPKPPPASDAAAAAAPAPQAVVAPTNGAAAEPPPPQLSAYGQQKQPIGLYDPKTSRPAAHPDGAALSAEKSLRI